MALSPERTWLYGTLNDVHNDDGHKLKAKLKNLIIIDLTRQHKPSNLTCFAFQQNRDCSFCTVCRQGKSPFMQS